MPVRPILDAQHIISPHSEELTRCVREGYEEVYRRCGEALSLFDTRTKRSMFRDAIVRKLRDWAEKTSGVYYFEIGQLKWIGFANQWIVRVKAIDDNSLVAVSPTGASAEYNRNEVPDSIADTLHTEDPATMLYLGHRANENSPLSPEISLICNNSTANPEWIWPLTGDGPLPALDLPKSDVVASEDSGVRIRVKQNPSRKEQGER